MAFGHLIPFALFTYILASIAFLLNSMGISTLTKVKTWSPFKIDALGLITLLGANPINKTLGRLVFSPYEYFPLLGGHNFADNSIADPVPGLVCYNISEGIMATDVSAWFSRWLMCQDLTYCSTQLTIQDEGDGDWRSSSHYLAAGATILLNVFLVIFPVLLGDWYGFAASFSLISLVVVRIVILRACRRALDVNTERGGSETKTKKVKLFVTLPNGNSVTVKTSTGIVQDCVLTEARPVFVKFQDGDDWNANNELNKQAHMAARAICWFAFGVHAVSLGMACLAVQITLVSLTLAFSVALVQGWSLGGTDVTTHIGERLMIDQQTLPGGNFRAKVYAMLEMSEDEEQSMVGWLIMPRRSNTVWWGAFEKYKVDTKAVCWDSKLLNSWKDRMAAAHAV